LTATPLPIARTTKTIRRSDGKAAGAILGFVNFVLRLYAEEQPRAIIVGWDTLETPTFRSIF
jgi:DNA polymerase I